MSFNLFMHHIVLFVLYFFFVLTCNLPLVLVFVSFLYLLCALGPYSTPSVFSSRVQLFKNDRCREAFEKLNNKSKIWAKRFVILDEVDPTIRANLESRG